MVSAELVDEGVDVARVERGAALFPLVVHDPAGDEEGCSVRTTGTRIS